MAAAGWRGRRGAGRFKEGTGDLGVWVWKAGGEIRGGEGGRGGAETAGDGRKEEERKEEGGADGLGPRCQSQSERQRAAPTGLAVGDWRVGRWDARGVATRRRQVGSASQGKEAGRGESERALSAEGEGCR